MLASKKLILRIRTPSVYGFYEKLPNIVVLQHITKLMDHRDNDTPVVITQKLVEPRKEKELTLTIRCENLILTLDKKN